MANAFAGFPTEGLEFLDDLGSHDKTWFDRHRDTYARNVVAPTKAFVVALGERLSDELSPGIVALPKTNGSIGPINNDLRFSPEKAPYKDHLLLRFWDGPDKRTAPTLMVRISSTQIGFASGAAITSPERWRELIDDNATGRTLASALDLLAAGHTGVEIAGAGLKRVPAPYPRDHPRGDLLRHNKMFQARWPESTPAAIHQTTFVDHCLQRLRTCGDIHRWFLANPT